MDPPVSRASTSARKASNAGSSKPKRVNRCRFLRIDACQGFEAMSAPSGRTVGFGIKASSGLLVGSYAQITVAM